MLNLDLWRISNHVSLNGDGGRLYSARWHTAGAPIVYLAASPAGALIEVLVHLELTDNEIPSTYTLLRVSVPLKLRIAAFKLPATKVWKSDLTFTRKLGDSWLKSRRSALARVPSALIPENLQLPAQPTPSRCRPHQNRHHNIRSPGQALSALIDLSPP